MTDWTDEKYVEVWIDCMDLGGLTGCKEDVCNDPNHGVYSENLQVWFKVIDPLNDWNQCMMLVEKMEAEGWRWCAQLYNGKYVFEFLGNARIGHHVSDNLNRTIIRAAALAMEVE